MFKDEYKAMENAGVAKVALLDNNIRAYIVSSLMAGAFIGIGVMLMSTVGAYAAGTPYVKLAMGVVFSVALSLVVIAGAELFTGNNMVVMASVLRGRVTVGKMLKLWIICFIANWIGSIIAACVFTGTGLANADVGLFISNVTATKMAVPVGQLICRGILCNFLVCLAVWCGFRCKSEAAKLIMIIWCITSFVSCGFEHSIANMTMLTVGMLKANSLGVAGVTIGGYFYNILTVAFGNIIGGALCVAIPYGIVSKDK
ncbi:MAG: formate/nitrite transporter family protein [Clostridiales bacterium]|nr:formate/nitrite transporter family protein [Candidatus Crickella merdequi]